MWAECGVNRETEARPRPRGAHPQAAVVQAHPGLLRVLLLQELVGLHAALAGLLRLGTGEADLGAGGVMGSDLGYHLTRRPRIPPPEASPLKASF